MTQSKNAALSLAANGLPPASLLVKGGQVEDGSGVAGAVADVRIKNGVITEIGASLKADGEAVLDARDHIVAPGFVDIHTHLDAALFWSPSCDPLPLHGVTSAVMGNCSLSLAPVRQQERDKLLTLFGHIEDLPSNLLRTEVAFDWQSTVEYFDVVSARPAGLRLYGLVGHSMLRSFVLGDEAWQRAATGSERQAIVALLEEALKAGAIGLSSSRFDQDSDGRLVPSALADEEERIALIAMLGKYHRHFQFIPEIPAEKTMAELQWTARVCLKYGVQASWNGLLDLRSSPELADSLLSTMHDIYRTMGQLYTQVSPRPFDASIHFDRTMVFTFMPVWNSVIQAEGEAKWALLMDEGFRDRARREWDEQPSQLFPAQDLDTLLIVETGDSNRDWIGRTFAERVAFEDRHPSDVLADWLLRHRLNTVFLARGVGNNDAARIRRMLDHPTILIGSGDAAAHIQMMCGSGDTTRLLVHHVRERQDISLAKAIYHLSARPAEAFGLNHIGRISPGAVGDLTIFKLDELDWQAPVLVDDIPGGIHRYRRPAGGYAATVLAGSIVQRGGEYTGKLPGCLQRGGQP